MKSVFCILICAVTVFASAVNAQIAQPQISEALYGETEQDENGNSSAKFYTPPPEINDATPLAVILIYSTGAAVALIRQKIKSKR